MSEITDYRVVEATDRGPLVTEVNGFIERGYQPYGDLTTPPSPSGGVSRYVQVMVRYSR